MVRMELADALQNTSNKTNLQLNYFLHNLVILDHLHITTEDIHQYGWVSHYQNFETKNEYCPTTASENALQMVKFLYMKTIKKFQAAVIEPYMSPSKVGLFFILHCCLVYFVEICLLSYLWCDVICCQPRSKIYDNVG